MTPAIRATHFGTRIPGIVLALMSVSVLPAAAVVTLTLDKTAMPTTYSAAGQMIGYSYLVTNTGDEGTIDGGGVTVSDDKASATCPDLTTVGDNDDVLDPGESVTCTASYSIIAADLAAGSVTNTATASATDPGESTVFSNMDSATVTAVGTIVLVKDAVPNDPQDFLLQLAEIEGPFMDEALLDDDSDGTLPAMESFSVAPGLYLSSETPVPAGWLLTNAECSDNSPPNSIDVSAGETVTCTFTNTKLGTIVIEKVTLPAGGTGFSFIEDIDEQGFSLDDGQSQTFMDVFPGVYDVTEAMPADWVLSDITCVDPSGGTTPFGPSASIDLAAGETVTCTFTNVQLDFGDAPTGGVEMLTGGRAYVVGYPTLLAQDGARHLITVGGPTLGPTIDAEADGQPTPAADGDDIDLDGDDEDGVTFTQPTLIYGASATTGTVDVDLQNADPSQNLLNAWIDFNGDGDWDDPEEQIFSNFDLGTTNGMQTLNFPVPADTGMNFSSGDTFARFRLNTSGGPDPTGSEPIGLLPTGLALDGEVEDHPVTLEQQASIVIVKDTDPMGSPQAFSFSGDLGNFELDGDPAGPVPNTETFEQSPGTYSVTEAPVQGWLLTQLSCIDPTENSTTDTVSGDATIELDAGETVTCTFTNSQLGKIIIDKVAFPTGDPTAFDFTLEEVEGPTIGTFSLADQDPPYMAFLLPGSYSVSENLPMAWDLLSSDCSNEGLAENISLSAGDTITCTFVNETIAESDVLFSKAFAPDPIGPGSSTRLTFTIANTNNTEPAGLLNFSDTLPVELSIAAVPGVVTDCGTPVIDAPPGGDTISMSFGSVGAGETCTVTVNITSTIAGEGSFVNTSGNLTSSAGNSGPATAGLTVTGERIGISKSFSPSSIPLGGTSTLTFDLTNDDTVLKSFVTFIDPLPADMLVATPANVSIDCLGAVTAVPGASVIVFVGGVLPGGTSCAITLDVTTVTNGRFENTTLEVRHGSATSLSGGFATAVLDVPIDFLVKSFTDDPVAPGGTVTLEFTIQNPDRVNTATAIAFTDPLPAGLTAVAPLDTGTCDGMLSGTTTLGYSGGSLAGGASCSFSVTLMVPAMTAVGDYTNTTTAITATIDGEAVTGNTASDVLVVNTAPILTKLFVGDPVGAGEDVIIRFTVTNTSTSSAATAIAFVDELTDGGSGFPPDTTSGFLPFPVSVVLPAMPCGAGSVISLISLADDRQGLSLTGGSLAAAPGAGSSCTFDVTVTIPEGFLAGTYLNTTEVITATVGGTPVSGLPASDDLVVVAAPTLAKEFTDDPVDPGDTVTLRFTLAHDALAPGPASAVGFTDPLPAGLTATGLPLNDACGVGNGTLSGTTTLTFSGATLAPGQVCTFSVTLNVPGGAGPGSHTNTTSAVTAMVLGVTAAGNAASDDLRIATLTLTKEFTDDPVIAGDTANLHFTLDNASAIDATGIIFSDVLGGAGGTLAGLVAVAPLPTSPCGATTFIGTTSLVFLGGSVSANTSCSFDVTVLVPPGTADGTYINTTSSVVSSLGVGDPATDGLIVDSRLVKLTKEFTDDPFAPGGTGTLSFTLTNLSSEETLTDVAFSDDLDAALPGLLATGLPVAGCGSTATTSDGGMTIDFADGGLDPSETCFFDVAVSVPMVTIGTVAVNTTSEVTGLTDPDDLGVVGGPGDGRAAGRFPDPDQGLRRPGQGRADRGSDVHPHEYGFRGGDRPRLQRRSRRCGSGAWLRPACRSLPVAARSSHRTRVAPSFSSAAALPRPARPVTRAPSRSPSRCRARLPSGRSPTPPAICSRPVFRWATRRWPIS